MFSVAENLVATASCQSADANNDNASLPKAADVCRESGTFHIPKYQLSDHVCHSHADHVPNGRTLVCPCRPAEATKTDFAGDPLIPRCPIVQSIPDPDAIDQLTARRSEIDGKATYRFDIRLQGEKETVFFDI